MAPSGFAGPAYPTKPVRIIVPFPVGGGTDILARLIAQKLTERLGQQFFVHNIGGAGGSRGTGQAAKAVADGYTLLFAFSSFVVNPSLLKEVPYDAIKDFAPVTLAATTTTVLITHPSISAKSIDELAAYIRANPDKGTYASGGIGTQAHLVGEQLRLALEINFVHVPFGGAGPSVQSVAAGHTPIGFTSMAAALPLVKGGKLKALAVTSSQRSKSLPDVQTLAEAGHPNVLGDSWVGLLVPSGVPKDIVTMLHQHVAEIIGQPETNERLVVLGYEPVANTPEKFAADIKGEIETWAKVIRAADVKVE
jgi:tripartite-type tricarboxylate transporter receptor subunit TctC